MSESKLPLSTSVNVEKNEGMLMLLVSWVMQMAQSYQRRKNDPEMPYSVHPQMVAINTLSFLDKDATIRARIAAVFHDVIEDCEVSDLQRVVEQWNKHAPHLGVIAWSFDTVAEALEAMLLLCLDAAGFDSHHAPLIIRAVQDLSVPKELLGVYEAGDKKAKKAWEASSERMKNMCDEALMVTWADKTFNLRSPMPDRDPIEEKAKYGQLFATIQDTLMLRGYQVQNLPEDIQEAIAIYNN